MSSAAGPLRTSVSRLRPSRSTVALTAALLGVAGLEWSLQHEANTAGTHAADLAAEVVTIVPLLLRRRFPVAVLVACCALTAGHAAVTGLEGAFWGMLLPLGAAHYAVARWCGRRKALLALALPAAAFASMVLTVPAMRDLAVVYFYLLVFGTSLLSGLAVRRDVARRLALREALARLEAEGDRAQQLAVLDQRTALARDLHDVVAHALSIMLVQARAARRQLRHDPDAARTALLALEASGRDATADLRRMLGLLNSADEPGSTAPHESLTELESLVTRMSGAGLSISLEVDGDAPLPAGLDLAAFRIVQEALTNVLKHAGPTEVSVRIQVADAVEIEVLDLGPRPRPETGPGSDGHGLAGMRERVALYGGQLSAQPDGEGFVVRALLPVPAPSAAAAP